MYPFLLIRIMGDLNHASDQFQQLELVLVKMARMKLSIILSIISHQSATVQTFRHILVAVN